MLTANGLRRSRDLVSVKLMKSDWTTGHAVKVRKSRQKGSARTQAALPSRRALRPLLRGAPRGDRPCSPVAPAGAALVVTVMASLPRPDGLCLLLHRLQGCGGISALLGDLLHLGVEVGDDLLPRGEARRRLGRLQLLAEL